MKDTGRNRRDLTAAELALAYELRQEGCCWKRIAAGLGCDHRDLRSAVSRAVHSGIRHRARGATHSRELLETCLMIRNTTRLGWRTIAEHFGVENRYALSLAMRRLLGALIEDALEMQRRRGEQCS